MATIASLHANLSLQSTAFKQGADSAIKDMQRIKFASAHNFGEVAKHAGLAKQSFHFIANAAAASGNSVVSAAAGYAYMGAETVKLVSKIGKAASAIGSLSGIAAAAASGGIAALIVAVAAAGVAAGVWIRGMLDGSAAVKTAADATAKLTEKLKKQREELAKNRMEGLRAGTEALAAQSDKEAFSRGALTQVEVRTRELRRSNPNFDEGVARKIAASEARVAETLRVQELIRRENVEQAEHLKDIAERQAEIDRKAADAAQDRAEAAKREAEARKNALRAGAESLLQRLGIPASRFLPEGSAERALQVFQESLDRQREGGGGFGIGLREAGSLATLGVGDNFAIGQQQEKTNTILTQSRDLLKELVNLLKINNIQIPGFS